MLPWLALTFTAARLGFEAQNAAAFRFMRLGSRPETAAGEIIPHAVALPEEAPATRGSRTKKASGREDVQEVSAGQAATQAVKGTLISPPEKARQLGLTERREGASGASAGAIAAWSREAETP